mmetsp:Transcript_22760/g.36552  ORF Transcript_22760/g.36552 Transcript_22760/m.36552 type:complete len:393 (+) Transcript_22760:61-1239(+)|eukprot:CAMPEP_0202686066 /NCGR_PEP_ID=MMETSP1385-20130828/1855_1 /ASSEMBLY_ACC=CAM_ASM_000861 /TAXON_ID=933848 /ORGANISM="Elphidium margaritaceum" /LENGTH=392 /DNA_ID=CAMNT_0049340569 /DNA_START=35 /DNA_END=1213 /DNA_ORIENTATION=+
MNRTKTVNIVVGGLALASIALFAYTVTRPTKKRKTKNKNAARNGNKTKKNKVVIKKKPVDINLVMESSDGFNALCAGDKKNLKLGINYGARLVKINDQKVEDMEFEQIMDLLQKAKAPFTLYFRDSPELNAQWTKADALKEEANNDFKESKVESAIEKVTAAIDLHPTNKVYYSNRILMFFRRKQYEEALKDCQTIRQLDPKSVYVKGHYLRGLTLLHLKRYKNAAAAFETVIKLNPDFKKASDRLDECKKALAAEMQQVEKRASAKQENLKEMFNKKQEQSNDDAKQETMAPPDVDAGVDVGAAVQADDDDKKAVAPSQPDQEDKDAQKSQPEEEPTSSAQPEQPQQKEEQAVQEQPPPQQEQAAKESEPEPKADAALDTNVVNTEPSNQS